MPTIPREPGFDSTLAVLREGFPFIWNRCQRHQSDVFQTRLMGQKTICLHGTEAARLFYDPDRFIRAGAVPRRIQTTLMGQDAIQTLDEGQHQRRKRLFMDLMTPERVGYLLDLLAEDWELSAREWEQQEEVELFPAAQDMLCRAACAWVGMPLGEDEVRERARDFGRMVDAFGGVGARHNRGKRARRRAEAWVRAHVKDVRSGRAEVPAGSPAEAFIWFEDGEDELLSPQMVAVELINLLRPIVAIATYITFGAKALAEHPPYRQLLQRDDHYAHLFAQEVRRDFPFGPFTGARVKEDFTWQGYRFPKGTLTLIDIYGTNHDPRLWEDPDTFWPERFANREPTPFDMLPQGGGDYLSGHRCAGEWITLSVIKQAMNFLARRLRYEVPPQDLSYDLTRMPTLPQSGFIMRNVQLLAPEREAPVAAVAGCPFHH
ncbi:cytochrome P450 [Hymenobacter terrenus]|uniref:cytochrome P450 n=1 Tax=Hymenobacter terrenus TaxID=1629124 RepID=UPI000619D26C|nr:cytochrome P450 [Hymenobacter terrenus]